MKDKILAALARTQQPMTAEDVANAIDEQSVTTVRLHLRDLVTARKAMVNERIGARATYALIGVLQQLRPQNQPAAPAPPGKPRGRAARCSKPAVALDVRELLAEVAAEPVRNAYGPASEYMEVAHALKAKKFTWREVAEWFKVKGIDISVSGWQSTYKSWVKNRPTPAADAS